ncbi:MAG: ATP-binding protein [Saprospiraceae bacterium]|nr:ATP-binding protein [Candidatus Vicinibacter affinis]MBK7800318.1 ATP-binding protein [Candidatus Vicinibacter affinis]MBP7305891.1 ATP-binding protein [Saprospiraceae bacterium]
MNVLLEQSEYLLSNTTLDFKRFLFNEIKWNNRLVGIKGARGTGKTTLLLQWLKQQDLPVTKAAYFSLDDLYFTNNSLKETVAQFHKLGGKILVLDEVHKYKNWSTEIKNIYDIYTGIKIIFTGSSIIDISRQQGDLSRRAIIYELPGLSYREFLSLKYNLQLPVFSLNEILKDASTLKKQLPISFRPLEYFNEYLQTGYYPFMMEDKETVHQKINQLIRTIVEYDMAELKDFDIRNAKKILQLMYVIAQQVPFKPNLVALAEKTSIHRNSLNNYLHYLEQAKLISLLQPAGKSVASLQKPEKIYLNNTNLLYALAEKQVDKGNLRETFFLSQLNAVHKMAMPKQGDFFVDNKYTFEVGGKDKSKKQIAGIKNAWVVKDDLEFPVGNNLPLWMFGCLY